MNCLSINIRGRGGGVLKPNWIKGIVQNEKVSFLAIQESQMGGISSDRVSKFWGNKGMEWDSIEPSGRSGGGGIISIWDPSIFNLVEVIKRDNFLVCKGIIKGCSKLVHMVNVYAPQSLRFKIAVWNELLELINNSGDWWMLMGDFNSVRSKEERKGSKFKSNSAREFNSFIEKTELFEYEMKGYKFTYLKEDEKGKKFSKIDRVLVSRGVLDFWPKAILRALPRLHSDHNPVLWSNVESNFGPRPFRFFNSWLDHPECNGVVRDTLENFSCSGPPDIILLEKFKRLRCNFKKWRDDKNKKEGEELEICKRELEELESNMEDIDLNELESWTRMECKKRILEIEDSRSKDLKQKARCKWNIDGDENSRFFHGIINNRKVSNSLPGLMVGNVWEDNPKKIKRLVFDFFNTKFKESMRNRPGISCDLLDKLSEVEATDLEANFTKEEIKKAAFDGGEEKAPGPDGFSFKFLKRYWNYFEKDFLEVMKMFHEQGKINKGCSSAFIAMIPKVKDPDTLNDYRPITLVGITSKIISKVLANRLKKVLDKLISVNQSAFLKDRLIIDGPLIINEMIAWVKKSNRKAFVFKVDFNKAFDNVNWEFLISVMNQMGFKDRWCKWIKGILSSARSAVLVNGSPTFEFHNSKGMRQGDPLSPFLFLIVMEGLTSIMRKAQNSEVLKGFEFPNNGPIISHLLYADDCSFLGEWSDTNLLKVIRILRCFNLSSGLSINIGKSHLMGIGVEDLEVNRCADLMKCRAGRFPCDYLGLRIGGNMNRIDSWDFLIDIFKKRLSKWKASSLSIGWRTILIKSVLESLPTYFFSLFIALVKVINSLESIIRRFLWGGDSDKSKIHWVAWDKVTSPICKGGLGLSKLKKSNEALIAKWLWRYRNEKNSLWRNVIESIHDTKKCWSSIPSRRNYSSVWVNIVKAINKIKVGNTDLNQMFKDSCGNGRDIRFWLDSWAGSNSFKERFPALFKRENDKKCRVSERYCIENKGFVLVGMGQFNQEEDKEKEEMFKELEKIVLNESRDKWEWRGRSHKTFSVKGVKDFIQSQLDFSSNFVFKWVKWIPRKCNIFMWRLGLDRIPTGIALKVRNCVFGSLSCALCGDTDESAEHLFCSCEVATEVWHRIGNWIKSPPLYMFSVRDIFDRHRWGTMDKKKRKAIKGVLFISCWFIWKARNSKKFDNVSIEVKRIVLEIMGFGFLCYKNRGWNSSITWDNWCKFELM